MVCGTFEDFSGNVETVVGYWNNLINSLEGIEEITIEEYRLRRESMRELGYFQYLMDILEKKIKICCQNKTLKEYEVCDVIVIEAHRKDFIQGKEMLENIEKSSEVKCVCICTVIDKTGIYERACLNNDRNNQGKSQS